jgi:hypothetical protein
MWDPAIEKEGGFLSYWLIAANSDPTSWKYGVYALKSRLRESRLHSPCTVSAVVLLRSIEMGQIAQHSCKAH